MSTTHKCTRIALFLAKFLFLNQSLPSTNRPKKKMLWLSNTIDVSNMVTHYTKLKVKVLPITGY